MASKTSWQTQLDHVMGLVDSMLIDMRELAEKHYEVSEDYDRAIDSWEKAKLDISHFSGCGLVRLASGQTNARTLRINGNYPGCRRMK